MSSIFNNLETFQRKGSFSFNPGNGDKLSHVCNVPAEDVSGIYLIFAESVTDDNLIYIGISGKLKNGIFTHRQGGLRGRIIKGIQTDNSGNRGARRNIWPKMMADANIDNIHVNWYITYDNNTHVEPRPIEQAYLEMLLDQDGFLPMWNNQT